MLRDVRGAFGFLAPTAGCSNCSPCQNAYACAGGVPPLLMAGPPGTIGVVPVAPALPAAAPASKTPEAAASSSASAGAAAAVEAAAEEATTYNAIRAGYEAAGWKTDVDGNVFVGDDNAKLALIQLGTYCPQIICRSWKKK
ncbi:unnamed protein product [Caenorhabditis auriculariae]|uniref:Uncharacterized protein n=1 Tax=Caenorhabditis auriculariae TaxID=2777116 RepID=A0A8S1HL23_9PELO|nr:unnamed protein product [Caenorhabditis auriculariae]